MALSLSTESDGKLLTFLTKLKIPNKINFILDCETTGQGFDDLNHSIS